MANKDLFLGRGPSDPDIKRTIHDLSFNSHVSYKEGLVYPCYLQEVPSKSTLVIQPSFAFDFHPMVFPIQNNVTMHMSFYKIPWRILWKNYPDWYSGIGDHQLPTLLRGPESFKTGSVLDHLGLPTVVPKTTRVERGFTPGNGAKFGPFCKSDYVSKNPQEFIVRNATYLTGHRQSGGDSYVSTPVISDPLATPYIRFKVFDSHTSILDHLPCLVGLAHIDSPQAGSKLIFSPIMRSAISLDDSIPGPGSVHAQTNSAAENVLSSGEELVNQTPQYLRTVTACLTSDQLDLINQVITQANSYLVVVLPIPTVEIDLPNHISSGVSFTTTANVRQLYPRVLYSSHGLTGSIAYDADISMTADDDDNNFASHDGSVPNIPVSALPLRAYDFLRNYVFRNAQIDPFYKNGQPTYNEFLTNDGDGPDAITPDEFIKAPYEYDMFTTCLRTPQVGHAPLVGISVQDSSLVNMTFKPEMGDPYTVGVEIGADGNAIGISNYDDVADKPNIHRLEQFIAAGIAWNDLRNTGCYQRYLERMQNTSFLYENVVQEFFGVRPPTGDHYPEYIGGVTRDVLVSKIQNLAQSEGNALGEFAGTANVNGQGKNIEVFCEEQSYIMGVVWFTVTPVYSQKLDRHWQKFHRLDLFNPQFANIGPQPVYKSQINPLALRTGHFQDVLGYNVPFVDLKSRQDEVHGEFRTTMFNFIQQRFFANAPDLGKDLIYMDPHDLADVFAVSSDSDKIYGIIHFDVIGELPIPRLSIPHIVG